MDIPPEQRDAARAFVAHADDVRRSERTLVRGDVLSTTVLALAVAVNAVNGVLSTSGASRVIAVVATVLLSVVLGIRLTRTQDRRTAYHAIVDMAEEAETALAFADLDDAEA